MAFRYAVLGLLLERRGYGYQLAQRLDERLGSAWQLNPASVYAALEALEAEGLARIELPTEPGSARPRGSRRLIYEATSAGTEAFDGWLKSSSARQEPIRPEQQLKLALLPHQEIESLATLIEHERRMLADLCERCEREHEQRLGACASWSEAIAALAAAGALARARAEEEWLALAISALRTALAAGDEAPAARSICELLSSLPRAAE